MTKFNRNKWMIIITIALVILTACGPAVTPIAAPTEAPTAESGATTTLVYDSNIDDMITLDPAVAYEFSGVLVVHNVYENLVQFVGADLSDLQPGLAEKWEVTEAGDNWEVTFHLRDGVKFASGNPLTADDVVYSFQRVINLNKSPAFLFTDIAQIKAESIKAADPRTVVVTMPKTASPQAFLSIITFTVGGIVDSKEVKAHESGGDFGSGWLLDHSAGSGPYVIDHWQKDVEVLLTANPNYGGAKPALNAVLVKHVPESSNQQAELEKGDADVVQNLSPEQIAAIKGKEGVVTTTGDSLLLFYVGMNVSVKPLDNVKVREALRAAVDYDGIINDLLSGNAKKVQGIIPAGLLGFNSDTPFQQDIDKAKALLKEGGQENGFTIEMLVPTGAGPGGIAWADLAAKLQSDWAKIGVTVEIQQVAQAELLGSYRAQKGQLVMILWGPDFPDPDANVGPFTDINANSIAFRNAWDDPIAIKAREAALITDPAKRAAAYKELTDYVLHNGPYIVLYQPIQLFGLRSNVKGFAWNPMGYADFWTISK
ncbi:MAG TPA: ABC transporter substrate-binding protein [Anaerolineales bacterium]|nr:ABC transporter substrate-binding protein [Anaerolineales bacterium]